MATRLPISKENWATQIFAAKMAKRRGIMRRKVVSVARYCDIGILKRVANGNSYRLERYGDQYLLVPNEIKRWKA
jgi:hypothetical protein